MWCLRTVFEIHLHIQVDVTRKKCWVSRCIELEKYMESILTIKVIGLATAVCCKDGGGNPTNPRMHCLWSRTRLIRRRLATGQYHREWFEGEEKRGIIRLSRYHIYTRLLLVQRVYSGWGTISSTHWMPITHLPSVIIGVEKECVRIALVRIEYKLVIFCLLIGISVKEVYRRVYGKREIFLKRAWTGLWISSTYTF